MKKSCKTHSIWRKRESVAAITCKRHSERRTVHDAGCRFWISLPDNLHFSHCLRRHLYSLSLFFLYVCGLAPFVDHSLGTAHCRMQRCTWLSDGTSPLSSLLQETSKFRCHADSIAWHVYNNRKQHRAAVWKRNKNNQPGAFRILAHRTDSDNGHSGGRVCSRTYYGSSLLVCGTALVDI